jgi:hypothetical protein
MYFKVMKATNGQYYFTANADNNQVLCTSETYWQKQSALDAIAVIKREAATAPIKDSTY